VQPWASCVQKYACHQAVQFGTSQQAVVLASWGGNHGLAESNGAGFMASVTHELTAENWDQLRNPTLVLNMGLPT